MQAIKPLAVGLCAALLAGCAGAPARKPPRAGGDHFEVAGRLAVNYRKEGNPESITGKFSWLQTPGRIDITLSSPMATIATISITAEAATLVRPGQAPQVAKDIDTLTARSLGWPLPVAGLRDWLQGYATGADGKRFIASPSNNCVLTADGWRLRFVSWQDEAALRPAPRRIDAERSAGVNVDELAIRIVIDPQG